MQILLLGGTGFIGSHLVSRLLEAEHEVSVLNRGKSKNASGITLLNADRTNLLEMEHALKKYNGSEFDAIIDTSSLSLRHSKILLAQLPRFSSHLIHISSASVYLECHMAKETDSIGGASIWGDYGVDKSDIDRFLLDETNSHDFSTTIYRPPYLYGPNDSQDRASFVWSRCEAGLPVFTPPVGQEVLIQFLHVADLVQAITNSLASEIEPGVYNIAGEEKVSLRQWVALVAAAASFPDPVVEAPAAFQRKPIRSYFPFRPTTLTLAATKLAEQGFTTSFKLLEGLEKTFAEYCKESKETI